MMMSAVIGFYNIARKVLILRQSRCLAAFELALTRHRLEKVGAARALTLSRRRAFTRSAQPRSRGCLVTEGPGPVFFHPNGSSIRLRSAGKSNCDIAANLRPAGDAGCYSTPRIFFDSAWVTRRCSTPARSRSGLSTWQSSGCRALARPGTGLCSRRLKPLHNGAAPQL
jgi:hypothetical protein